MKGVRISDSNRKGPMSEINVVPYIDVMLVLLVIFMVTAPMLTQGVNVDLPETAADPVTADKNVEPLVVSVDANGAYYVDVGDDSSEPMSLADVQERVSKVLSGRSDGNVLVRGDENVNYGVVVRLMARLQDAGATGVGLITEDPDKP
ncbi:cell division and transport-associated protein TolR [Tamilnaduibacter salinus]|uniref:Tol-Pal system protein TolR n=1 Tax=Tamilnaduibacter salinus TaxID=1484056 RepID=A0A2A2I5E0_9GAMM|nr:protein TolR [Tamilnaduibacter salinus]PAV26949.1 protein TolR [Tamilnaduibacter salinus]PVY78354.1 cell division and transport-associated protein TolR [Tamilnaduibacter salinus]